MIANATSAFGSNPSMDLLSRLLLRPESGTTQVPVKANLEDFGIAEINREEFDDLAALGSSNHVIMRALKVFSEIAQNSGDFTRADWATTALAAEAARIDNAVSFLRKICEGFEAAGYDVTVIKSLDHWPDLGSDLDLYTNTDPDDVIRMMKQRFQAEVAARSWGDRLANKWNFNIPGLPEAVEIHMRRLGQTGEQISIASSVPIRARVIQIANQSFRVTSVSDRLMISTLQRMYRHFYFRLCDIIDSASLADAGAIDYDDLRNSATAAGIWEGVATYLVIVSEYVQHYRGRGLEFPSFVKSAAQFGGDKLHYRKEFLRVPILPESAALYASQLTTMLRNREFKSSARLSLLPYLATAAAVGQKITGSDKGIW